MDHIPYDWLAMIASFIGTWQLGERKRAGWILNAISSILWAAYGVTVHSWPIIIWDIWYLVPAYRGWKLWKSGPLK